MPLKDLSKTPLAKGVGRTVPGWAARDAAEPEPYRCVRAGAGRYRVMRGDIRESRDFPTMTEARKAQTDLEAS